MKRSPLKPRIKPLAGILRTANLSAPGKPKLVAKQRMRKCKVCETPFVKRTMSHVVCSNLCAIESAKRKRELEDRKEIAKRKRELQPKKWWRAKAKEAMHAYIRARDEGKPCISCDTILLKLGRVGGDYDAGHFRSVGSAKHLEFVENNIHGQCKRCNDHLRGNPADYEQGLIERFNVEYVEALKNDQAPRHLSIADYQEIEATYKAKLKELACKN